MKPDTVTASRLLMENHASSVFCRGKKVISSNKPGIVPLLELLKNHADLKGFCTADRIVGKAAAFLYIKLGVSEVYAPIMSEMAVYTLARHGIIPICDRCVPYILNKNRTEECPVEKIVAEINDAEQAVTLLAEKYSYCKVER